MPFRPLASLVARLAALLAPVVLLGCSAEAGTTRDYVAVVGSSTVYPFTTTVAEQFGRAGRFKTPKVESTGTGGGFKLFCGGVGVRYPDVANASRAIKASEVQACASAGVRDIIEMKIGYDGIVVANSVKASPLRVTRRQLFLALAKTVPDPADASRLIANPYDSWNQIDAALPPDRIEVLGPPPTSGTRDAFVELVMQEGAITFPELKALKSSDEAAFTKVANAIREDGHYVEAGENDNLIVQKLQANPKAYGIFGHSFLEENISQVQGAVVDGVQPDFEHIVSGAYPVSRPLYVYVKKAHVGVIPGLREFLLEYASARAIGEDGYLGDKGLVPLTAAEAQQVRGAILAELR